MSRKPEQKTTNQASFSHQEHEINFIVLQDIQLSSVQTRDGLLLL